MRRLQQHRWPGNVRELKNVITRAALFSPGGLIRGEDIVFTPQLPETSGAAALTGAHFTARPTRSLLTELLEEEQGNISALSRRLKVCTKTIYRWLRHHHIDLPSIRETAAA